MGHTVFLAFFLDHILRNKGEAYSLSCTLPCSHSEERRSGLQSQNRTAITNVIYLRGKKGLREFDDENAKKSTSGKLQQQEQDIDTT